MSQLVHKRKKASTYKSVLLLVIILVGATLRIAGCAWGKPEPLHPDEGTIVFNAVDLVSRRSFEPNVFHRPDHFEIQCNSILFNLYSYLVYQAPVSETFGEHSFAFFFIARCFTAFWGILMIWVGYLVLEKVWKGTGLIGAFLIAFFPAFITHSHYATPDIPLSAIFLICIYFALAYLEKADNKSLAFMCLFSAIACTIKYTGAVICLFIAGLILFKSIEKKDARFFFRQGFFALGLILLSIFLISPVIFTNLEAVIEAIQKEARTEHLGADGLGYFGNLLFYAKEYLKNVGIFFIPLTCIGIWRQVRCREKSGIALSLGVIYWIFLSALALHWERWGLPMYLSAILFGAIGIRVLYEWMRAVKGDWQVWAKRATAAIMGCIALAMLSGSITNAIVHMMPDSRVLAKKYCEQNRIVPENSVFDGYIPFAMTWDTNLEKKLKLEGDTLILTEEREKSEVQYILLGGSIFDRIYAQPERYHSKYELYQHIRENLEPEKIYATPKLEHGYSSVGNIVQDIRYLVRTFQLGYAGYDVEIYKVQF